MNKADGFLDEEPKLFFPSALIIGYVQETTEVSSHVSPDHLRVKTQKNDHDIKSKYREYQPLFSTIDLFQ